MRVSHEVPAALMQESRIFNDYDYALVHKFKEDQEYFDFYKESLRDGRTVYLDNSLFELEEMFDHDEFAKYVQELGSINPENFYYIVPDSLEEYEVTVNSFKEFMSAHPNLLGKSIGVVQGKNLNEIEACYDFMANNADMIAISFDYSWYESVFPDEDNKYFSWMNGRQFLMDHLKERGLSDKPHHLLGCGLPQEFKHYKDGFDSVVSCDTSNPIVMGMLGHQYSDDGLRTKESIKLIELYNSEVQNLDKVMFNVDKFKEFCRRG